MNEPKKGMKRAILRDDSMLRLACICGCPLLVGANGCQCPHCHRMYDEEGWLIAGKP